MIHEWKYQGKPFQPTDELLESYQGFVYCLMNLKNGKKYIGKKFFWSTRRLPPLKGKKRKRISRVESNWRDYCGSSEAVQTLVEDGVTFEREILRLCQTKGECSYYEAKLQFEYDVLLNDEYYNEFIGCKIHAKHLKS
jgi:hypothetical protein